MKRLPKTSLWVCAAFSSAAIAFGGVQGAPQRDMGERIVNRSCLSCHDTRPIDTQALDKDGWTKIVNTMVEMGAELPKEDIPVVIEYLVKQHGPLPDGAGKGILLENCTLCHNLERVRQQASTREEWDLLLAHMLNEGAELSDEEYPVLLNYLARNFRPKN